MIKILIVTGLSGAGKSTCLKALEDFGYETIDNLPLNFLRSIILDRHETDKPVAIHLDTRTKFFSVQNLLKEYEDLKDQFQDQINLLFLRSSRDILARRYTETRHAHPMALGRPVLDGIDDEFIYLTPLLDIADQVIDTSDLSVHDLKRTLKGHYFPEKGKGLYVHFVSFSYKKGIPRTADLVFDMRFLTNPHYNEKLRPLTGKDRAVQEYIEQDPDFETFQQELKNILSLLLPRYEQEGKSYLTIAIGCSGGKHRSVYLAISLYQWLQTLSYNCGLQHREIGD